MCQAYYRFEKTEYMVRDERSAGHRMRLQGVNRPLAGFVAVFRKTKQITWR